MCVYISTGIACLVCSFFFPSKSRTRPLTPEGRKSRPSFISCGEPKNEIGVELVQRRSFVEICPCPFPMGTFRVVYLILRRCWNTKGYSSCRERETFVQEHVMIVQAPLEEGKVATLLARAKRFHAPISVCCVPCAS